MYESKTYIGIALLAIAGLFFLFIDRGEREPQPFVVFTQVPSDVDPAGTDLPGYERARIVRLNYEDRQEDPQVLTSGFYAASSPSLSFDNEQLVFSGKKSEGGPWQIWLMNLDGSGKRKVLETAEDALTPAFLPNGKIVFSRRVDDPKTGTGFALYTCLKDGTQLGRITFQPHRDLYSSVLHDGRIAMVSRQLYPVETSPRIIVLRPDGTKALSFYYDRPSVHIKSTVRETEDHKLIFARGDETVDELVALSYADPGLGPDIIAGFPAGDIHSADILNRDRLAVSIRSQDNGMFGIYGMNFNGEEEPIFNHPDFHSIEPAAVRKRSVPKKLPSSISADEGSGILVGVNAMPPQVNNGNNPAPGYIRVFGIERAIKDVRPADDGSFYLSVQNDMPIRLQRLDELKREIGEPSPWIWIRTNERRACLGCFTHKTTAPPNLVPEAIHYPPVTISDTAGTVRSTGVQVIRQVLDEPNDSDYEQ